MPDESQNPSIGIVGGGLAGMAAAAALTVRGCRVEVFERRKSLGGRVSSFHEPKLGGWVDYCPHVSLGCCTNFADFCGRLGLDDAFSQHARLNFIGPNGRLHCFAPSRWLPAPLHLIPALWRLRFLQVEDRIAIGRTLYQLARRGPLPGEQDQTMATWLRWQGQSDRAMELFWKVVLVSALSDSLDRIAIPVARKVFTDGMMAAHDAHVMHLPTQPLRELFHCRAGNWLADHGVTLHLGVPADHVFAVRHRAAGIVLEDGSRRRFDFVILAVPWHRVRRLLPAGILARLPEIAPVARFESSPITAIHLMFDQPITPLTHAVLTGRLSQWLFEGVSGDGYQAYQIVISASHELLGTNPHELIKRVQAELTTVFPAATLARLLHARVVTQPAAVFAPLPEIEEHRPAQLSAVDGLLLAGDWTATGWPATMESAIQSGYLAAQSILNALDRPEPILAAELPRSRLARWILECGRKELAPLGKNTS